MTSRGAPEGRFDRALMADDDLSGFVSDQVSCRASVLPTGNRRRKRRSLQIEILIACTLGDLSVVTTLQHPQRDVFAFLVHARHAAVNSRRAASPHSRHVNGFR